VYFPDLDHLAAGIKPLEEVLCDHLILALVAVGVILIPLRCLTQVLLLIDLIVAKDILLDITEGADEEHGSLVRLCRGPGRKASIECALLLALGCGCVLWLFLRPRGVH
jgi:hypothetical protein